jgi:hypothetical protein
MLLARGDHHHVSRVERERLTRPVDDDAAAAQPEKELRIVVAVPIRARALVEAHPIEAHGLAIVPTHQALHTRSVHEVGRVGGVVGHPRLIDPSHFSCLDVLIDVPRRSTPGWRVP